MNLVCGLDNLSMPFHVRSEDPHITNGFLFAINLRNEHNHEVSPAEALMNGDVLRDTCDKLQTLFQNGHSPSSAFETLKVDLQEQELDSFAYPEEPLDCGLDGVETDLGKENQAKYI